MFRFGSKQELILILKKKKILYLLIDVQECGHQNISKISDFCLNPASGKIYSSTEARLAFCYLLSCVTA